MINTENTGKEIAEVTSSLLEDEAKKLPDKSRSLRAKSIQKRLETERHKNFPKASIAEQQQKDIIPNVSSSQSRTSISYPSAAVLNFLISSSYSRVSSLCWL